ncbi:uncharacterized protein TrAFT101_010074 [Trichoderma asperellum]|uniref:Mid2 domain-containing protein n=1 Tax=Trichoderma asperellum (strain ATCC 204424 / CBS 433.97 / NBRC 101777) TaxID=1042311 RepID=A0A2T3Z922_TRIA4|nr:hypothetical protein M441DRAFT_68347 [Trichoderma asperellum CBS 433.97]PTB41308.1 hypothetical protein M441DRAFT_68347 [Trichoderma asperellum CBS 433.97]UKZ95224.1 hypothetical protein TrAFT101_010074 [Trichoderma asperellum]
MRVPTAYATRLLAVLLFFSLISIVRAQNLRFPQPTPRARLPQRNVHHNGTEFDKRADIQTGMSNCGFLNGDPKKMRTANPGFDCRVDTMNGLWGFCPVTVISATDCGFAGSCVDQGSCSSGCGNTDQTQQTTFTCGPKQFCSTVLLTFGVDQSYSYIACGRNPTTEHYLISPTSDLSSTTMQSSLTTTTSTKLSSTTGVSSSFKSTDASPGSTSGSTTPSTTEASAKETASGGGGSNTGASSTNNTGAIIGGVIGGIALLCFSSIAAIFLLRRNRPRRRQTLMKGAQRNTHQSWYDLSPKTKHRFTGGWGPRELPGTTYERTNEHPIELPS